MDGKDDATILTAIDLVFMSVPGFIRFLLKKQ